MPLSQTCQVSPFGSVTISPNHKVGVLLCMRTSTNLHCCDAALKINETLNAYFVTSLSHNFRWEICETSNQLGTL